LKEEHALLAGEMSGHIFFRHRYFGFDDGIYSAARLLELIARARRALSKIARRRSPRTFASPEIRFDFPEEKKFRAVELAKERLRKPRQDHRSGRGAGDRRRRMGPGARLEHATSAGAALGGDERGEAARDSSG